MDTQPSGSSPMCSRCSSISARIGFGMQSLVSTCTGEPIRWLNVASGTHADSMKREVTTTPITLSIMGTPQNLATRILFHCGRQKTLILMPCLRFLSKPVQNTFHHVPSITTTLICGTQRTIRGMLSRWAQNETLLVPGGMPHSKRGCGLA